MPYRHPIQPGLITLHGNQTERLSEVVIRWLEQTPLNPLESEVILVQSNSIAEWCKMEFARLGGVCAATRVELPSRFLWRTYRQVLAPRTVPSDSPLDKIPMTWRLMALLPDLLNQEAFAPLRHYLRPDEPERALHLASQLADLFDQYQNYRADWLEDWGQGRAVLRQSPGDCTEVPPEQGWQPLLWQAVLATLGPEQRQAVRSDVHREVVKALRQQPAGSFTGRVARRVVVFGISHLPGSTIEALAALAAHSQVILAIPNPCRYFWGDIMTGREWFRTQSQRQASKPGPDLSRIALQDLHHHTQPLLAAWGRQSRDFVRLLDQYDAHEETRARFPTLRLDVFEEGEDGPETPLLLRLQRQIRDLEPLPADGRRHPLPPASTDRSIVFHIAHSRVRELEVLHDQLLDRLAQPATEGQAPLQARDIVVMVPNIQTMAAAIEAVFGQFTRDDPRFIPFGIADMSRQDQHPALLALLWVLRLPRQRCTQSELLDLLEVPAVARRFGLDNEALPVLRQWMSDAGICWGLDQAHRAGLELGDCAEQNSAWFGLQRMLWGYASGTTGGPHPWWSHIEPCADVRGLEADWAGGLAHLIQTLRDWQRTCTTPATPAGWVQRYRALLLDLFDWDKDEALGLATMLEQSLQTWLQACEQAQFTAELPWFTAQQAWEDAWKWPDLEQRFHAGGVTFCTLMPMRAIPFEMVCLLGMNESDYPRRGVYNDFDLMRQAGQYRPGDRSRQQDDRQLLLEAVLSARRTLYIGWTGRSVRDNHVQPPSVLVSQLRDHLAQVWGAEHLARCTTEHPLQPFGRRYFEHPPHTPGALHTYAHEWRSVHHEAVPAALAELPKFQANPEVPLDFARLEAFLRNPVKVFYRERLGVDFALETEAEQDHEPFWLNELDKHILLQQQLQAWRPEATLATWIEQTDAQLKRWLKAGQLPMQGLGERECGALSETLGQMAHAWAQAQQAFPKPAPRLAIDYRDPERPERRLADWIDDLREDGEQQVLLQCLPQRLQPSKQKSRHHVLVPVWLRLLAAASQGQCVRALLVGRDAVAQLPAVDPKSAAEQLAILLACWETGMQSPLPLPLETSLAFALENTNNETLAKIYEGDRWANGKNSGENRERCLARQYPGLSDLVADGHLARWAPLLYQRFHGWAQQVSYQAHPSLFATEDTTP